MMIAAGQSPMQMAIQQGTSITQVIGPMGAAGAVSMLKTAFLSMLNPTSFATYAILAGGAALIQWAMGAGEAEGEALSLKTAVSELGTSINTYKEFAVNAAATTDELRKKFGSWADEVKGFSEYRKGVALADVLDGNKASIETLKR